MKVVHIESGLGNQMLGYVEYLAIKKNHPTEKCYIETIIYEIPEASEYICQWNGYELDRIFGLDLPNIRDLFSDEAWEKVIDAVKESRFWEHSWNYPEAIVNALNIYGNLNLSNICVSNDIKRNRGWLREKLSEFFKTDLGYNIRRKIIEYNPNRIIARTKLPERLFFVDERDLLCGFTLLFRFRGNQIETLEKEIRKSFVFPEFIENNNIEVANQIMSSDSVAIHVRRGDMVGGTQKYNSGGYFRRAVKLIKREVSNPQFYIFSDPDSVTWAKNNLKMLGLNRDDCIKFVDWNKGKESYRDMQLMTLCKNCIITLSSFSWWSAFLIDYKNKITVSPEVQINTTHHC
ncbi:alpha-1,2-fucosyltransferase [Acetobacterium sp.]|uniref:alpha-1,2-fucosyltransferase n=1 Tax=Acetobacterium sp. TaxID=1872094 RepID=UPI003593C01D